jgi:hypothetical protein
MYVPFDTVLGSQSDGRPEDAPVLTEYQETYLFRAACSELRTEVQNARKASDEQMRHERTLLQHEVDILNQKLTQELLSLKDDLQGMFNDRKMSVRQEQRSMDSSVRF